MRKKKLLVLYNKPLSPADHPAAESEYTIVSIAEYMAQVLGELGYQSSLFGLGTDPLELWRELKRRKPDVILNMYEGQLDDAETESYVAGLLTWSGIPFTGSPPRTLSVARAKHQAKLMFKSAGLPTADFFVIETANDEIPPSPVPFPVMVKPAGQDASVGIEHASVCRDQAELEARVRNVLAEFGPPVLIEQFIPGREILVAVTEIPELRYLPPSEIQFPEVRDGAWPILTYSGKWRPGTPDYESTPSKYPADLPDDVVQRVGGIAMKAFRTLGCRDYARIDFRLDPTGQPYILEVNPNPEISDDTCFGHILQSANIPFNDFLTGLIETTLKRAAGLKRHASLFPIRKRAAKRPTATTANESIVPDVEPALEQEQG